LPHCEVDLLLGCAFLNYPLFFLKALVGTHVA